MKIIERRNKKNVFHAGNEIIRNDEVLMNVFHESHSSK